MSNIVDRLRAITAKHGDLSDEEAKIILHAALRIEGYQLPSNRDVPQPWPSLLNFEVH